MTLNSLLIDLILLIIIGISVYFAARRGFVRTFIEAIGFLAAGILALTICTPLANTTYDKMIEPPILEMATEQVDASFEDTLEKIPDFEINSKEYNEFKEKMNGSIDEIFASLPDFAKNYINQSGMKPEEILESADEVVNDGLTIEDASQKLAKSISQNKIKPLVVQVLSVVYSSVILVLSLLIVKILAVALNKAVSFSIAGKLNVTLGGVCGLVKGLIFALLLCVGIYIFVPFTENGIWIFTLENIEKTLIFKALISLIKI